jgi:hypothetical protein
LYEKELRLASQIRTIQVVEHGEYVVEYDLRSVDTVETEKKDVESGLSLAHNLFAFFASQEALFAV